MGTLAHFGEKHPEDIAHRNDSIPLLGAVFGLAMFAAMMMMLLVLGLAST